MTMLPFIFNVICNCIVMISINIFLSLVFKCQRMVTIDIKQTPTFNVFKQVSNDIFTLKLFPSMTISNWAVLSIY